MSECITCFQVSLILWPVFYLTAMSERVLSNRSVHIET